MNTKTKKQYINVDYQKLVDFIEQNPQDFVGKLNFSYKGKTVEVEKGSNNYKLLWNDGYSSHSLFFSGEDIDKSFIELKKYVPILNKIIWSLFGLSVGLTVGKWSLLGFLGFFISIWLVLPILLSFQSSFLTSKFASKIEKEVNSNN
jgi:hypothetical protein